MEKQRKEKEKRANELAKKILKLEAFREIQNVMGKCTLSFNYRMQDDILGYFSKRDDRSIEIADEGVFCGKHIKEAIGRSMPALREKGEMIDIQLASPIIEIAEDLETARAQWVCPGIGAITRNNADPQAIWNWGIIGADFIFEDGQWKIWHFHWFRLMKCDYHRGWVEDVSLENRLNTPLSPNAGETTYHNPYTPYSVRECIPMYPKPYDTWKEDNWMLNKNKQEQKNDE